MNSVRELTSPSLPYAIARPTRAELVVLYSCTDSAGNRAARPAVQTGKVCRLVWGTNSCIATQASTNFELNLKNGERKVTVPDS